MTLFFKIGREHNAWLKKIKEQCVRFLESSLFGYGNYLLHDIINHLPAFTALFWSMTVVEKNILIVTINCLEHEFNI